MPWIVVRHGHRLAKPPWKQYVGNGAGHQSAVNEATWLNEAGYDTSAVGYDTDYQYEHTDRLWCVVWVPDGNKGKGKTNPRAIAAASVALQTFLEELSNNGQDK